MSDELATVPQQQLAIKPLEALQFADQHWINATALLSQVMRGELDNKETALFHEWMLKRAEDVDEFRDVMRKRLLEIVKTKGSKVTDKGTLELDLGDGKVQRASPVTTLPDSKLTEQMLRNKKLSVDSYMLKTIMYKASDDTLKTLLAEKLITEDDYKSCFKPTSYKLGKTGRKGEDDE